MIGLLLLMACSGDDSATDTVVPTSETGTTTPGELFDPLSMPIEPTHDPAAFGSAEYCGSCHEGHYDEWRMSMHAYAMVDPVFQRLVELRQADLQGTEDRFCMQCHTSIGTRGGEIQPGFSFTELSDISMEGVTCESCHKVTELARDFNSGHVLDPGAPLQGPNGVEVAVHPTQASDLLQSSAFCGGCHDVIEVSGLDLERPYREWLESPAATEGQDCQSCHMPYTTRAPADGRPEREVRQHLFVGVGKPLVDGWFTPEQDAQVDANIRALLATAATIDVEAPSEVPDGSTFDVTITIHNEIAAHNFPTGSTFNRQVWLELIATDGQGNVLYTTGDLDGNGDLRDYWSELDQYGDNDLISLSSNFVDANGAPTVLSWVATEHTSNALSPLYERTYTLFIPTALAKDPKVTIDARLRFRAFPPYLLRYLGLGDKVSKLDIYDLASDTTTVTLQPDK